MVPQAFRARVYVQIGAVATMLALLACAAAVPTSGAAGTGFAMDRFALDHFRVPAAGYAISVTVLRPRGRGPFGAVVLNHGAGMTAEERQRESPEQLLSAALAFARRGYAVVMPLRRGFGSTGGAFAEDAGPCAHPDYRRGERAAAADVLAAYAFARRLPYIDGRQIILAGQSAGGIVALSAAARRPPGLVAVLAFAAGRGGDPGAHPGTPCAVDSLAELFQDMGRTIDVPVLLYYAQNDLFFGPAAARAWFARFSGAGAHAELFLQPAFRANGHFVFSDPAGVRLWLPRVADFLRRHHVRFGPDEPARAAQLELQPPRKSLPTSGLASSALPLPARASSPATKT